MNADQDKINKLPKVLRGVYQANDLYDGPHAFFQTYLAIITEVEASGQDDRNIPSRGVRSYATPQRGDDTKTTTFRQIVEFPGRAELHDGIGIVHIEIVQPSRFSIYKRATVASACSAVPKSANRATTSQTASGRLCCPTPDGFLNRETRDVLLPVAALSIRLGRGAAVCTLESIFPTLFPIGSQNSN